MWALFSGTAVHSASSGGSRGSRVLVTWFFNSRDEPVVSTFLGESTYIGRPFAGGNPLNNTQSLSVWAFTSLFSFIPIWTFRSLDSPRFRAVYGAFSYRSSRYLSALLRRLILKSVHICNRSARSVRVTLLLESNSCCHCPLTISVCVTRQSASLPKTSRYRPRQAHSQPYIRGHFGIPGSFGVHSLMNPDRSTHLPFSQDGVCIQAK